MRRFISFGYKCINLDMVRTISRHWSKNREDCRVTIIFNDGETQFFQGIDAYNEASDLEESSIVISAAPGFRLIRFWFSEKEDPTPETIRARIFYEPIIAWRVVDNDDFARPIGLEDGPTWDAGRSAILQPDGYVIDQGNQTWRNVDEWSEDVCADWIKWLEKRAAA